MIYTQRKKILVYHESSEHDQYHLTENKMKCPYAKQFEGSCELIFEKKNWQDLHSSWREHKAPTDAYYKYVNIWRKNPILQIS